MRAGVVPERARPASRTRRESVERKRPPGIGAAPEDAGLVRAAGLEGPDHLKTFRDGDFSHRVLNGFFAFAERRVGRRRDFLPGDAAILGAVDLGAEVAVADGDVDVVVAGIGQDDGEGVADEGGVDDLPAGGGATEREEAFAGGDEGGVAHFHYSEFGRPDGRSFFREVRREASPTSD